jgi:hypothetical protein
MFFKDCYKFSKIQCFPKIAIKFRKFNDFPKIAIKIRKFNVFQDCYKISKIQCFSKIAINFQKFNVFQRLLYFFLKIQFQALLCSNELTTDIVKEIVQFIQGNSNIIGFESILVCIYPLNQSIDLILKSCPHVILEYSRCHFKMDTDWTYLIKSLQKKVSEIEVCDENLPNILFYHRLLKGEFF